MLLRPVATAETGETQGSPCLYLGPQGQRCSRSAGEGGYCDRHDPERAVPAGNEIAKRLWAAALLIIFLWPWLMDLYRMVSRWVR